MSDIAPIFSTQNVHDDDAAVVDSYFIETDTPPDVKAAIEPGPQPVLPALPLTTKLLSKETLLDPTWTQPTQILPADANRKSVYCRVYSPTVVATDGVRFASNNGETGFGGKVLHAADISFLEHTGSIYAIDCNSSGGRASAAIIVEIWSVTT